MAIRNVIIKLQAHAKTAGAKEAPTDPDETAFQFPFTACYPGSASIEQGPGGGRKDIVNFELSFHVNRVNLPIDIQQVESFYDAFPTLLVNDPTLGGTVNTIVFDEGIKMEFGKMKWADTETIGMKFTIPVKIE